MIYAYLRVSTKEQNLARQIVAVKAYRPQLPEENIFCDKASGKNFKRKEYERLKELLRPGDELIVKELDRLGRNKAMTKDELLWFKENGIKVRILNIPTTLVDLPEGQEWVFDMVNNILIEVISSIAQEEYEKRELRQKEGIAAMPVVAGKRISAKTGKPMGRVKLEVPDFPVFRDKVACGELSVVESCKQLGISRTQWYRLCKKN